MIFRWTTCAALVVLSLALGHPYAGGLARPPAIGLALASRSLQPGEPVAVPLSSTSEPTAVGVIAFGKRSPTFDSGNPERRALVGIDVEQAPGRYTLIVDARVPSGAVHETRPLVVLPKTFATRTLKVSPDFVNPPPAELERIARE